MEGVEMELAPPAVADDDFCPTVRSHFSNSNNEHHHHVCNAMAQEFKDQNLRPLTPITYFVYTCSSLDRLIISSGMDSDGHLLDRLLTILSLVIDRLSPAVIKTKYGYLYELLIRILRANSVGVNGILPGLKCSSRSIANRDQGKSGVDGRDTVVRSPRHLHN